MAELLALKNIRAGYGEAEVLEDIHLSIREGETWALLGRNGMGKSTLICTIMGLTRVHGGEVLFDGASIGRLPVHARAHAGIGWVPQERLTFASLTVEEHLTCVARPGHWDLKRIYEVLPTLEKKRLNLGKQLSGGEQQMLAIARALMINPRLLLLDEPLEGLAPIVAQDILRLLRHLSTSEGLALLLVEQHARDALELTSQAIVLERGRVAHIGSSAALLQDEARLGELLAIGGDA